MNGSRRPDSLAVVARWVVDRGAAPAAVVSVAWRNEKRWVVESAAAGRCSAQRPDCVSDASVFDLASLTKPIVAVTAAREAARQGFPLSTPVGALHPTLEHTPLAQIPVELLLAHRAGLVPHLELFAPLKSRATFCRSVALKEAANATVPARASLPASEGYAPLYSDLGYLVIGEVLEYLTRRPLDELVRQHIAEPLALELGSMGWWLKERRGVLDRVVPTEHVRWRGGELLGQTHDENAWAWSGHGTAGHAGLFGTAQAVCGFGCAVIDAVRRRDRSWVTDGLLSPLVLPRPGGTLRAGFDGKCQRGSSGGDLSSMETVGHLGFTGTSFWCDPANDVMTVLLTNRVSPSRERATLRDVRPWVHDSLFAFASAMRR